MRLIVRPRASIGHRAVGVVGEAQRRLAPAALQEARVHDAASGNVVQVAQQQGAAAKVALDEVVVQQRAPATEVLEALRTKKMLATAPLLPRASAYRAHHALDVEALLPLAT